MLIRDSEAVLRSLLAEAGVGPGPVGGGQALDVVDAVRRFVELPVEDAAPVEQDGDALLAQFGTHAFSGTREFEVDLTRQLVEPTEQDPRMWQLSCTLRWGPDEHTDALGSGALWSSGTTWPEFFAEAVQLRGWAWALRTPRPAVLALDLGPV